MPHRLWFAIVPAALVAAAQTVLAHSLPTAAAAKPVLRITARPPARPPASTALIRFSAAGARRVTCRHDGGRATRCRRYVRYRGLTLGRHTVTVDASNALGRDTVTVRWRVSPPAVVAVRMPILLYHVVATPGPATPNQSLWVDPSEFAAEMDWLAVKGRDHPGRGRRISRRHDRTNGCRLERGQPV